MTTEQQNSSVLLKEEAPSAPESQTEHLPLNPRTAAEIGKHPGAAAALLSALHGGLVQADPVAALVKARFRPEQAQQFAQRHGLTIGHVLERLEWAAARDWATVRDGGKPIGSLGGWLRNSFERQQGRPARLADWKAAMSRRRGMA